MQILAGKFKGKRLQAGPDLSIRPITSRIKDSIFAILGDFYLNKMVLDVFSGSGSLGIEALSRGASIVTFVDLKESALQTLHMNLERIGADPSSIRVRKTDAMAYCASPEQRYDLVFLDPPFRYEHLQRLVESAIKAPILTATGLLVLQHEKSNPLSESPGIFRIFRQKKIGRNLISFIIEEQGNE